MAGNVQFKVEKNRVLVPVGQACRFGCKYCYTRKGEVGPSKVDAEEILRQFEEFMRTHAFETIQFGYDGDPFDRPERGAMMLQRLARLRKNISFSTKALLDNALLNVLVDIHDGMLQDGNTLVAFISLSCWDSARLVEPHTPTAQERVANIENLKRRNIPTYIALRPILPGIRDREYEQLAQAGIDAGCGGFVLGPLYADEGGQFVRFIPTEILTQTPHRQVIVPWSAHAPTWRRYEDEARLHRIASMIERKGGKVFLSSVDAIEFAHEKRKVDDRGRIKMPALTCASPETPFKA
ncbi:radical SAM protein [Ktedonobacter robiniae]|uniref:Radical SAM core domain-containing protein n=1 Tax=Ktedonobacter robiniae TaxID=2778365 RepID=A0ABQ3UMW3_9CHLR|nr:radical SAM protein [Ktedonobacter robiniae]GHO53757.1 hypothetical protein KSB_22320 [Ktedonobacter robiniae]